MSDDGLPWLRLLGVMAILSSLFLVPVVGFWVDGRRKRRLPPTE